MAVVRNSGKWSPVCWRVLLLPACCLLVAHGMVPVIALSRTSAPGAEEVPSDRESGTMVIRVEGNFSSVTGAWMEIEGAGHSMQVGPDTLSDSITDTPFGTITANLEVRFESTTDGNQSTTRLETYSARFRFAGVPVQLGTGDLQNRRRWIVLGNAAGKARLVDDPCVLETRLETDFSTVDADRGLYGSTFGDLLASVIVQTDAYEGGNLFALLQGEEAEYLRVCNTGAYELADTLICIDTGDDFACLSHAWKDRASGRR